MAADILTVPLVHPPRHCKSHSSHILEIGFWYSPLWGVCVCVGEKQKGEEWIINLYKWVIKSLTKYQPTPHTSLHLELAGRDTTEQFCTQRLRYWKLRQPSHCVSLGPQQLDMESHCSWQMKPSLTMESIVWLTYTCMVIQCTCIYITMLMP